MPVSNTQCIGRNHVWDQHATVCRCGAYASLGARGMVPIGRATPLRQTRVARLLSQTRGMRNLQYRNRHAPATLMHVQ